MEQFVYLSCARLQCVDTDDAPIVLCLKDTVELISGLNQLPAILISSVEVSDDCNRQTYWRYTIQYDETLLTDPETLLTFNDVETVFCETCFTEWLRTYPLENNTWLRWFQANDIPANILKLSDTDDVYLNAPTGKSLFLQIAELTGWSLNLTRDLVNDALNGGNLIMTAPGKAIQILNGASLDSDITAGSPTSRTVLYLGSNSSGTNIATVANGANNSPNGLYAFKTRAAAGSWNANTILLNNDNIWEVVAWGADGANYSLAGALQFRVDGAPALGSMPGRLDVLLGRSGGALLRGWSFDSLGRLLNDATNGSDLVFTKATTGIQLQSGANGRTGTFSLNGAAAVVVANTSLAAGDKIELDRDTPLGTPGNFNLTARSNGTSFTVTGTALDTSGMRYTLVRIN